MATLKHIIAAGLSAGLLLGGAVVLNAMGENVAEAQTRGAKATVDAAKRRGEVGEQIDGYLGIVDGSAPSAAVRAAVSEINIARKAVYTDQARRENADPANLAAVTGEKQVNKTPRGEYYRDSSGSWKQK